MGASRACILLPVSLLLCAPANPSRAQGWTHDASLGIKLTQTATSECVLGAVPDAKGGAMFIWADPCSLYATLPPVLPRLTFHAARVLRRGDLDTTFPATLPFDPHTEFAPSIKPDSTGGAYILWGDLRDLATTNRDLYAHHVRADGTLDPTWPAQGRALCTAFGPQFTGSQTSDANRGLIAVWVDRRDSVANTSDIYATHLRANGTLDPLWPTNGLAVHAGPAVQTAPYPIEDGAGGALVFWTDARTPANKNDVYGMHVLANGTLDPAWPAAGFVVAGTSASESSPRAVSDGAGGAFES